MKTFILALITAAAYSNALAQVPSEIYRSGEVLDQQTLMQQQEGNAMARQLLQQQQQQSQGTIYDSMMRGYTAPLQAQELRQRIELEKAQTERLRQQNELRRQQIEQQQSSTPEHYCIKGTPQLPKTYCY